MDMSTVRFENKIVMPMVDSKGKKVYETYIKYYTANADNNTRNEKDTKLNNKGVSTIDQKNHLSENKESSRKRYISHTFPEDSRSLRTN